ncbi:glucokinase [Agreia bicolorata]|uniref:Glucokinase n=1 Tax=Agreia bicolorata TaxID=110935 RepID=A0A1T4X915_9MICO|nr:ROK family protein [Agreia bicolorata]SKA86094.1 glucokinase [Agreia bicolorata]
MPTASLNPTASTPAPTYPPGLVLAVDFGGTKVESALVDDSGTLVAGSRFRHPTGRERSASELADAVVSVATSSLQSLPESTSLRGIGIGAAGPIDRERGLVSPVNLPAWRDFPLRETVAAAARELGHDAPAVLRLDGLCITLAENWVGAGRGTGNMMGMIVSTGVGGGVISGSAVVAGFSGNAGHIGQLEVPGFTDVDAPCTLEEIAAGPHTVAWAQARGFEGETGEDLARAYAEKDRIAVAAVTRSGTAIGRAIASVSTLLDLELVVIGGGFSLVTPDLFDIIRTAIDRYSRFEYARRVEVVPTGLDTDGPLIGAAALVYRSI